MKRIFNEPTDEFGRFLTDLRNTIGEAQMQNFSGLWVNRWRSARHRPSVDFAMRQFKERIHMPDRPRVEHPGGWLNATYKRHLEKRRLQDIGK